MSKYDEYVAACADLGTTPLAMNEWRAQKMQEARQAKAVPAEPASHEADRLAQLEARIAELNAQLNPPPPPPAPVKEWGDDGSYTYQSDCYELELVVQAGARIIQNGSTVTIPHKTITFSDGYYTTRDKDVAAWIEDQPEFTGGAGARVAAMIWRADSVQPRRRVTIHEGPKTTHAGPKVYQDRPSPLHAHI